MFDVETQDLAQPVQDAPHVLLRAGQTARELACAVERITDVTRLEALLPQWRALLDAALVPAVNQDPAWVLAAARSTNRDDLIVLAVWSPFDGTAETRELIGLLTVSHASWHWGLPRGPLRSMMNAHVFDGAPLLHRDHARLALSALFRRVRGTFLLESLAENRTLRSVLETACAASGRRMRWCGSFERGVWTPAGSAEDYLKRTHSRGRRNKFRRWRKQLAASGDLRFVSLEPGEDLEPWWHEFADLEARGWKGRAGTAVACSPVDTAYFHGVVTALHAEHRLHWWKLTLDGRAIAMLYASRHHRHLALGKITYDEDQARFTPGALMLLDVMDWCLARGDVDFVDPCGRPGNAMIDALWAERLTVCDVLISARGMSGHGFGVLCSLEAARRAVRPVARRLRDEIKPRLRALVAR